MSYFTGWFERVIRPDAKLDLLIQEFERFERSVLSAIKLEEIRMGKSFNSELIEKRFNDLDRELCLSQLNIKHEINIAFDKHFERNKAKETNK